MTQENLNALDHKLLTNWQCDQSTDVRPSSENPWSKSGPDHRPGYGLFKAILIFAVILSVYALLPFSKAHAGSPLGLEAGGYMYFSVPLMAAEPKLEETSLRFDFRGAGMYLVRLEMKHDETRPHFYSEQDQVNGWRRKQAEMNRATKTAYVPARKPRRKSRLSRSMQAPGVSARGRYLKLLSAYKAEPSSAERRRMYPELIAAYNMAKTNR